MQILMINVLLSLFPLLKYCIFNRFCVEKSACSMSRCKSPVSKMRHERGSSADTGLIHFGHEDVSINESSMNDPNTTFDERVSSIVLL